MTEEEKYVSMMVAHFDIVNLNKFERNKENLSAENVHAFKVIQKILWSNSRNFCTTIEEGSIFYRAREVDLFDEALYQKGFEIKDAEISGYDAINSREPNIFLAQPGRCNYGSSYLYLADNIETACYEIRPEAKTLISVAKFEVRRDLKVVDFTENDRVAEFEKIFEQERTTGNKHMTELMYKFGEPGVRKITQYVADMVRKNGYDGLKYLSPTSESGKCLTLFNSSDNYIKWVESKVYFATHQPMIFVSLIDNTRYPNWLNRKTVFENQDRTREDLIKFIHKQRSIKQAKER